jgi:signal transduction histidine kinase
MSTASRRLWWAALVICAATLAGIVIGELTVDLPRVRTRLTMVIGPTGAGVWVIAGLIAWRARPESRVGPLMVLIGWLHPAEPLLGGLFGAYVQWIFWLVSPIATLILILALSFPSGRLTGSARVAAGLAWAHFGLGAVATLFQVRSVRCPACPPNPLPFPHDSAVNDAISAIAAPLWIAAWALTAVILAQRWRGASPPARRALNPMLWGMLQYAVIAVLLPLVGFGAGDGRPDKPGFWSFALIPVGFLIGMLRTRQHRSVVADLMVELGSAPEPRRLRQLLARTLGDPSLQVAFWLPDRQTYVDADGSPVELPAEDERRRVSVLQQDDEPLAALVYDPALLEDPKLLGAVTNAARLALENSRLQAELRARLQQIRDSRRRLVNATDAERKRIERNLHDGAQQTLLGLRIAVRLARNQAGADPAVLDALLAEIDAELQAAVEELRALARGVHPAVLSDAGLEPALAELARRAAIPTRLTCDCAERLPPAIETAAYYVAAEALANVLKHAHASHVEIALARADGHATIEVADDGCGGADRSGGGLSGLRDRVEALEGTLAIDSDAHTGTRVRAEFPLLRQTSGSATAP